MFHSGRIAIATVGLPARGKTYVYHARSSSATKTYVSDGIGIYLLLWQDIYVGEFTLRHSTVLRPAGEHRLTSRTRLGVKTRVFHLGDYRRENLGHGQEPPDDYFFVNGGLRD